MKICVCTFAFLVFSLNAFAAPAPIYTTVDEDFQTHHDYVMDRLARRQDPEEIKRVGDPLNPLSTFFAWGGRNAAAQGAVSIDNSSGPNSFENPASGVIFNDEANTAGSFAYTRFDTTSTDFDLGASTPSVSVNASEPGAKLRLVFFSTAYNQPQTELLGVMIRDNVNWWVSTPKRVPVVNSLVGPTQSLDYDFHGAGAVDWTQIDTSSGGGADMDQVDNGGQSALTLLSPGTPNFGAIEGMGLAVFEGPGTWFFGITEMQLIGPAPTTGILDWSERYSYASPSFLPLAQYVKMASMTLPLGY